MKPRDLDSDVEVTFDDNMVWEVIGNPVKREGAWQCVRLTQDKMIQGARIAEGQELWLNWCRVRRYRLEGGDWLESPAKGE